MHINDELIIRPMVSNDLPSVLLIEQLTQPAPWTHKIFLDCLQVGYQCWALERRHEVVGFAILAVAASECHILNLAISPLEQGRGMGYWLMKELLAELKKQLVNLIVLEVRVTNLRAQKLYRKLQFTEIGRRMNYYQTQQGREDAIVMSLNLN